MQRVGASNSVVVKRMLEEHALIAQIALTVPDALDPFDADRVEQIIGFLLYFVDQVHHAGEHAIAERIVSSGKTDCEHVVRGLLTRHAALRGALHDLTREFRLLRAGTGQEQRVQEGVREVVDVLAQEMERERWEFVPLAERCLAPEDNRALLFSLDRLRGSRVSDIDLARYRRMGGPRGRGETLVVARPRRDTDEPTDDHTSSIEEQWEGVQGSLDAKTLSGRSRAETGGMHMKAEFTYNNGGHQVRRMTEDGHGLAVEANQYLIVDNGEGIILDPGGPKIYPNVVVDMRSVLHTGELRYVFLSHQDPDIVTSLNAWLIDTTADVYTSRLWARFVPHFGVAKLLQDRLRPIPDEGLQLPLGETQLLLLPAHFLHSCGNFQVYDPVSKTLFSGDLGASIGAGYDVVENFDRHLEFMAGFHRRYMGGRRVLRAWAAMVRQLDIQVIAPQHGAIFRGSESVDRFIEWCEKTECGPDLMSTVYRIPD